MAWCAREAGWELITNPSGANLLSGVATALLAPAAPRRPGAALFEVDEAALSEVARQLPPRVLLLMNLFRDQLDRHGELEQLADRWERLVAELPPSSTPVLNADDPAIAALAGDRAGVLTFGIDDPSVALPGGLPHAADSTRCRACSAPLTYDLVILGHLGHWRCPRCDARRPGPDVRATRVELRGVHGIAIPIETPAGPIEAELALPGVHNAYNATAAAATALAMGVPAASIARGLADQPGGLRALGAGAPGRARAGAAARQEPDRRERDRAHDPARSRAAPPADRPQRPHGRRQRRLLDLGRQLRAAARRAASLTLTGDRAYDLALRVRYSGVEVAGLQVLPDPERALDAAIAATPAGGTLYVLPTYTAMLGLRETLVRRGVAEAFWRER